jgi:hypothetical protein
MARLCTAALLWRVCACGQQQQHLLYLDLRQLSSLSKARLKIQSSVREQATATANKANTKTNHKKEQLNS